MNCRLNSFVSLLSKGTKFENIIEQENKNLN